MSKCSWLLSRVVVGLACYVAIWGLWFGCGGDYRASESTSGSASSSSEYVSSGYDGGSYSYERSTSAGNSNSNTVGNSNSNSNSSAGSYNPGPQAGTLTAGSFDDHYFPDVFLEFVDKMASSTTPASLKQRNLIEVLDRQGKPIADAIVVISHKGKELVRLRTGSDGQALFLGAIDNPKKLSPLTLTAQKGTESTTLKPKSEEPVWNVTFSSVTAQPVSKLDVAFVVDATGSMGDEIRFLKAETHSIVQNIVKQSPNFTIRFALIVYRDQGDAYVTRVFDFADLKTFQNNLNPQSANGGGDEPEAMDEALLKASQLSWGVDGRARMLFLLADAPPHHQAIAGTFSLMNGFRKRGIRVYPVAASGVKNTAEYVMRVGAFKTLARYIFLSDDSGYGSPHADPNIPPHKPTKTKDKPCYNIEKLNSLMVRMMLSELRGKPLPPSKEDVLRQVGTVKGNICDPSEMNKP